MTKGRTTSFDERVEIVQHCIKHNHNYIETSEKYQISYQQARNYTVKYELGGVEALKDNRGKRKSENQMTELELLRAENKILRAEKESVSKILNQQSSTQTMDVQGKQQIHNT